MSTSATTLTTTATTPTFTPNFYCMIAASEEPGNEVIGIVCKPIPVAIASSTPSTTSTPTADTNRIYKSRARYGAL